MSSLTLLFKGLTVLIYRKFDRMQFSLTSFSILKVDSLCTCHCFALESWKAVFLFPFLLVQICAAHCNIVGIGMDDDTYL